MEGFAIIAARTLVTAGWAAGAIVAVAVVLAGAVLAATVTFAVVVVRGLSAAGARLATAGRRAPAPSTELPTRVLKPDLR
jgi:hypothetical protein